MRAYEILHEMIIRHRSPNGGMVLAHGANIWVLDDYDDDADQILADIKVRTGLDVESIEDLANEAENRPDIVVGYLDGYNGLTLRNKDGHHPASSPLLKKVARALGLSEITIRDMADQNAERQQTYQDFPGDIPDIVYHGTNTRFLRSILRTGIRPTANANWKNVANFQDKIFLTADPTYAAFHANSQAEKNRSAPVVIAVRIPDRSKITLDYDVADRFHGPTDATDREGYTGPIEKTVHDYDEKRWAAVRKHSQKTDFTKATGVFGYRGRIPPSFFVSVESTFSEQQIGDPDAVAFEFRDREELMKALDMYEDIGYYDPDYDPESDDDYDQETEDDDDFGVNNR